MIVCAGQERVNDLEEDLKKAGMSVHLVGGAFKSVELDAKFAIKTAAELAAKI